MTTSDPLADSVFIGPLPEGAGLTARATFSDLESLSSRWRSPSPAKQLTGPLSDVPGERVGAHALLSERGAAPLGAVEAARLDDAPANRDQRRLVRLAFLAPQIQRDILVGRQPPGLTLEELLPIEIPASWADQIARLG